MRPPLAAIPRLIGCAAVFAVTTLASPAAQQPTTGAGLTLPFSTTGATPRGTADVSGTLHITQFVVQNNAVAAVGTVVAHVNDPAAQANLVTRVVLPIATVSATAQSGTTTQQVFGQSATTPTTPDMFATTPRVIGTPAPTPTTAVGGTSGAAMQVTTSASGPAQGTCGPVHMETGPLDLNFGGLVAHLDRLVVDLAVTPSANVAAQGTAGASSQGAPNAAAAASQTTASSLNSGLCSIAGLVGQGQVNLQNLADLLNQVLATLG